jgi:hypothetical protein
MDEDGEDAQGMVEGWGHGCQESAVEAIKFYGYKRLHLHIHGSIDI